MSYVFVINNILRQYSIVYWVMIVRDKIFFLKRVSVVYGRFLTLIFCLYEKYNLIMRQTNPQSSVFEDILITL